MVEAAGADIVDINFGCPVRKVTKTGAGATLLDDPERACRIVAAVAEAVDVPVTVKMRRGLEDGSRACLDVGPRLVEAGAATLTLHPRSAKQMYTGDGRPLADRRARRARRRARDRLRRRHLARAGAGGARDDRRRRGDGRPRRAGQPLGAPRDLDGDERRADARGGRRRAAAVHPRDRSRAGRAPRDRLPEEVLRLVPRPRPLPAPVQAGARPARVDRRGGAAAARRRAGRRRRARAARGRAAGGEDDVCSTCRSRSTAAADRFSGHSSSPAGYALDLPLRHARPMSSHGALEASLPMRTPVWVVRIKQWHWSLG